MKLRTGCVVFILPLVLTGCFHRGHKNPAQPLAPAVSVEPTPQPQPEPAPVTPPPAPKAEEPKPQPEPEPESKPTEAHPKPPVHHKKPTPTKPADANPHPGVSAIGMLSSGASDQRSQAYGTIYSTERSLNSLNRRLSDSEQRTAAQIREFLKQARAALSSGDTDGGNTLAMKAKVLLGELSR